LISAPAQSPETTPRSSILYLSLDGMLEPLGRSQVLSYLYPLSDSGFRFAIISLEREQDINAAAVSRLTRELSEHGIEWRWDRFHQGGIRPALRNLRNLLRNARELSSRGNFALVHARSFLPAAVARILKSTNGTPYVFDLRGYWVEEKAAEGAWVTNRVTFRLAKWLERHLLDQAAGVVTLTALHAADIPRNTSHKIPSTVIPTCTDYELFTRQADQDDIPADVLARLRGKLVIGIVGSIRSTSYRTREALQLFAEIRRLRSDAHLLCLTRQLEQMTLFLRDAGIPDSDFTLLSIDHEQMPAYMTLIDWALLLLSQSDAKRGSMPTKLAEFFASEVRIVLYGCNSEVADHVRNCGAGMVLKDLSREDLKRAAHQITSIPRSSDSTARARTLTRLHFGLESGVRKYEELFHRVLGTAPALVARATQPSQR
jgi:glycosyltransferase involved in cell wall biosynthesis